MAKAKIKCVVGHPVFSDKIKHIGYAFESENLRFYYSLQFKRVSMHLRHRGNHLSLEPKELADVAAFITFCDGITKGSK